MLIEDWYGAFEESHQECERLRTMIRKLCNIVESEYPETDERYEFAMNCLTDVGEQDA